MGDYTKEERRKYQTNGLVGEQIKELYQLIDALQEEVRDLGTEIVWIQSEQE